MSIRADSLASAPPVDGERLWRALHDLAKIGATPAGGVRRLAFTDADRAGRAQLISWCRQIGMVVERDLFGNIFAVLEGVSPDLPAVMIGSHIDSQPTGGKYDGTYGVMCGLEIARAIQATGTKLRRSLELVAWANEEGARFSPPMMGSGVFTSRLNAEAMLRTVDSAGISIGDELAGDSELKRLPMRQDRGTLAYLEAHIEQGPVLEQNKLTLGIVSGAQAQLWYDATIVGQEAHAGPTPMEFRRDALMAASELALGAEQIARAFSPDGRATVGVLSISPSSRNVVPGKVLMSIDVRHPDDSVLAEMDRKLREVARRIATSRNVDVRVERFWHSPSISFSKPIGEMFRDAAGAHGVSCTSIWSGAGHDAVNIAAAGTPVGMLFIPSVGGLSHNEAEAVEKADVVHGCEVFSDVAIRLLESDSKNVSRNLA